MPFQHRIYGLYLTSTSPIPGLDIESGTDAHDVRVHLKKWPPGLAFDELEPLDSFYVSQSLDKNGKPAVRVATLAGGKYGFFYGDGACFAVERDGSEVWADWPDHDYSVEDAATYLIGPVMGFVLRLHGALPLHASAVAIGGRAIALLGPPGAGKSTTAAAFSQLGFHVMSDDIAALRVENGQFLVQPGYPRVNLWPDSVQALLGSEDALPGICPTWDKRFLSLDKDVSRFERRPLPLGAIYVLGEREVELAAPVIEEMEGQVALVTILANTYVNYLLDSKMRKQEFSMLGELLSSVPIRYVRPTADPADVASMCKFIRADVAKLLDLSSIPL